MISFLSSKILVLGFCLSLTSAYFIRQRSLPRVALDQTEPGYYQFGDLAEKYSPYLNNREIEAPQFNKNYYPQQHQQQLDSGYEIDDALLPELMMKLRARRTNHHNNVPQQIDDGEQGGAELRHKLKDKIDNIRFLKTLEVNEKLGNGGEPKSMMNTDRKKRVDWSNYFGVDKKSVLKPIQEVDMDFHPHFNDGPNVLTGNANMKPKLEKKFSTNAKIENMVSKIGPSSSQQKPQKTPAVEKPSTKADPKWVSNDWFLKNFALETNM